MQLLRLRYGEIGCLNGSLSSLTSIQYITELSAVSHSFVGWSDQIVR